MHRLSHPIQGNQKKFQNSDFLYDFDCDCAIITLKLAQGLDLQLIHPDDTLVELAYDWTRRLNRTAAYDSFYLALTESLSAEFWTADKRLANVVNAPWVHHIADSV